MKKGDDDERRVKRRPGERERERVLCAAGVATTKSKKTRIKERPPFRDIENIDLF